MAQQDTVLRDALAAACRRAWEGWTSKLADERFYAFALYTTMDGEYFVPSVAGENGLTRVARQYVRAKSYANLDEARRGLRWSFADSPYHDQGERYTDGVEEALDAEPIPYDKSERATDRVIKARLDAAVDALTSLDRQGVFGKGLARQRIVLLIEAGDRDQGWALSFARRLNPRGVYEAFAKQFETPTLGRFKELGSKKVYTTERLALTADGGTLLALTLDTAFGFDARRLKQLWAKRLGDRGDYVLFDGRSVRVELPEGAQALDLALDPRGRWLATAMDDNRVLVFDAAGGKPLKALRGHKGWPRRIAVSPDSKWLASADDRAGVFVWDSSNWSVKLRLKGRADAVSFDGTSKRLVTTLRYPDDDEVPGSDAARVWDLATGKRIAELAVPGWKARIAVLSPDGRQAACGLEEPSELRHKAALIDVGTGRVLSELQADFESINDFVFLKTRPEIAVAVHGPQRKPLVLWDAARAVKK